MANTAPDIEILDPEETGQDNGRERVKRIKSRFWPTVRKAMRTIPFMRDVIAAYYAMLDPQTPLKAKATIIGALAYFVAPLDAIPDFVIGLGFMDDAAILAAALASVSALIKPAHIEAADRALADSDLNGRPKSSE